jgi:hypothetical protein
VIAPAHRLGNRQRGDRVAHELGQQLGGARARRHRAVHEAFALGVAGTLELRPVDAGLLREALQRARGLAVGVERDVEVGAEHFAALFRLHRRDRRQQHGEAAWRVQRARAVAAEGDAAPGEAVEHAVQQRLRQPRQRLDRQFLGAQLDQQRRHVVRCVHASCSPPCGP